MSARIADVVPDDANWLELRLREAVPDLDAVAQRAEVPPGADGLSVTVSDAGASMLVKFEHREKRHYEAFLRVRCADGRIQWYKFPEKLGESIPEPEGESHAVETNTEADAETAA